MSRQVLKDSRFRIIGYIDTAIDGKQTGRNARFQIVGYFDPRMDVTKDHRFHIVGHGNLLASLIACN